METTLENENSAILQKEKFQENADFIYQQWKPTDIGGWKTHVLDVGKGEPIVFVPICQGLEAFDSLLIQYFSRTNRVITYQRREDENQILDRESRANDLRQVLDYLAIDEAHFVAHSSASIATTTLALKQPSLFLSYVWMNLSPKPAMDMAWWRRWAGNLAGHLPLPDRTAVSIVASSCSGGNKSSLLYARCYEQFMSVKRTAGVTSIKKWFERNVWSQARYDWSTGLEKLTMPILLMNSDNDLVNSVKAMGMLERQLPNSYGYKIVEGGRHLFQYVCSDQVIGYMEEFYGKL
jgi:pimeloyl-ACP methyl ester carboxylesterase